MQQKPENEIIFSISTVGDEVNTLSVNLNPASQVPMFSNVLTVFKENPVFFTVHCK